WYIHFEHRIDILMQSIMCTANTDLVTLNCIEIQSNPFPNLSVNHQCKDFNTLVLYVGSSGASRLRYGWCSLRRTLPPFNVPSCRQVPYEP
ncbi:hypothetical protein BGZ57DRAFT_769733, partial [Hyaloscypha finlandica]